MSTEKEAVERLSSPGTSKALGTTEAERGPIQTQAEPADSQQAAPTKTDYEGDSSESDTHKETRSQLQDDDKKPQAIEETIARPPVPDEAPRQVIAVSASKGPAAFFNLARKFLASDEMCDLSALEGAIVSAVDAAHLLERSQLATIVRVHTSYVTVEPKQQRRKQPLHHQTKHEESSSSVKAVSTSDVTSDALPPPDIGSEDPNLRSDTVIEQDHRTSQQGGAQSVGAQSVRSRSTTGARELRRARIVITVRRTESYQRWLEENPLQAIIAGNTGDGGDSDVEQTSEDRSQTS